MTETFAKKSNTHMDVVECLLQCREQWPDHEAVTTREGVISYQDFVTKVRCIASVLSKFGDHPRVLIALDQGIDAYASMFAVLYCGGYYTPLNTAAPKARTSLVLSSFQPEVVIVSQSTASQIDCDDALVVVIEDVGDLELKAPRPPHDLAYVIFTSGSTGTPKGVQILRPSLAHYIDWAISYLKLGPQERVSQHPNIGFDLSVIDIYGALCSGACLVPITSKKDRMFPAEVIRDLNITTWISVPSMMDIMDRARQLTAANLSGLRQMFFCGEPLLEVHLKKIFAALPKVSVINAYGPTEATVSCTAQTLTAEDHPQYCQGSVSFGNAIEGMTIKLMNNDISGEEGEIVIVGPQVALGYWNDVQRSQERFAIDPDLQERSFRTGDWAKKDGDKYYFVQRTDRQIKIHGNRLELGEIDVALRNCGVISAATVYVKEKLISYVEVIEGLDLNELHVKLREHVASYAIPEKIIVLPMLPRNSSDKINYVALCERALEKDISR